MILHEEALEVARKRGLYVKENHKLIAYEFLLYDGSPQGKLLAESSGFYLPLLGYMHCDVLKIYNRRMNAEERRRIRKSVLGLSPVVGGIVFSYGIEKGCDYAEILSIDDEDEWAERLVRFYSYFGFQRKGRLEGRVRDLPRQLQWGGMGTLMDMRIRDVMLKWTRVLRRELYGERYLLEGDTHYLLVPQ